MDGSTVKNVNLVILHTVLIKEHHYSPKRPQTPSKIDFLLVTSDVLGQAFRDSFFAFLMRLGDNHFLAYTKGINQANKI